ncbi:MAG: hypothetical protein QGI78_03135 [Phycisphaerales bacterium]|jgi:hypothetical protein|nr:hypothetical protein [Phycisphaerales bacterium]
MDELHQPSDTQEHANAIIGWIGALAVRLIVPGWIFYGAFTKALGASPKSLPRTILDAGSAVGFADHLHLLLAILVAIEFAFIGVMLFIPKLARRAAILMLSIFLVVLIIAMARGETSCGCLGDHSFSPLVMFIIDACLLLCVIFCKPKVSKCRMNRGKNGKIAATLFTLFAWIFTFSSIFYANEKQHNDLNHVHLPASWYPQDVSTWVGQSVDAIDLFTWVQDWPNDIHEGKQYIIFYARTCDHCQHLLYEYFSFDVQIPTTLVAIPEASDGFFTEGVLENPCFECKETELPIGVDWIIGTPLVVAIENGIVKCANENEEYENPQCLIW